MRTAVVDGLKTLFYDGSKELLNQAYYNELQRIRRPPISLVPSKYRWNFLSIGCKQYWIERWSWEQVIVEEGVTEIARNSFYRCHKIKRVIFAKTVTRVCRLAFHRCTRLCYIKLPSIFSLQSLKCVSSSKMQKSEK